MRKDALIGILLASFAVSAHAMKLSVHAASSLTDVMPKVAEAWKRVHRGDEIALNFDGSSRLAKQIEQGAPADIFFSADEEWMDYLAKREKIVPATRQDLLQNEIVWVVPASLTHYPKSVDDLEKAPLTKLGLAGENVPIARYARAALEHAQVWKTVEPKIVRGDNVRTSLKWAAEKAVDAAIVYRTDALANAKVKIAFAFPSRSYPTVIYPAAVVKTSAHAKEAADFIAFLGSRDAKKIFEAAGFK